MIDAGYARSIGLPEVGAEMIRRAGAVHPIVNLQIEYSLVSRSIEAEILPTCPEHRAQAQMAASGSGRTAAAAP